MDIDDLQTRFRSHDSGFGIQYIRTALYAAAVLIDDNAPDGREKSIAITKLEEAMFWTNASIARAGDHD